MKANRLSADVEILVAKESKVEFGYMDAPYHFKGQPCLTGTFAMKTFPGDSHRAPQEFQSGIIKHRIETKNQAILAAGARKMTEIRLGY
jgi:hypothetical protein